MQMHKKSSYKYCTNSKIEAFGIKTILKIHKFPNVLFLKDLHSEIIL